MKKRKSPGPARRANPDNSHRSIERQKKRMGIKSGDPHMIRLKYPGQKNPKVMKVTNNKLYD